MKRLIQIKYELEEIAQNEAMKLFRLARRAKAHGCSNETVEAIRNEAFRLRRMASPEMLLDPFQKWEYAFK